MGLSLARSLARSGAGVTLFTASGLGEGGASAVPAALLNPFRGRSGRAHPDDLRALATTWRWAAELASAGLDAGAHRSGVVRVADGPRQARAFATVEGLQPFAPGEAPAPFRAPHGGAVGAEGGWLDPRRWTAALAAAARAAGATLRATAEVVAVERTGGGRWRIDGHGFAPAVVDRLILAVGAAPWPDGWRAALGEPPAFDRLAGDVVTTSLPAPALPLAGAVYLAPATTTAGAVAAVGGHHRPPGPPGPDAAERLRHALAWAWPALAAAPTRADAPPWWGVRAHGPGNRPQLVELAPGAWWCGTLAGRGFLAAADRAEAAAARVNSPPADGA